MSSCAAAPFDASSRRSRPGCAPASSAPRSLPSSMHPLYIVPTVLAARAPLPQSVVWGLSHGAWRLESPAHRNSYIFRVDEGADGSPGVCVQSVAPSSCCSGRWYIAGNTVRFAAAGIDPGPARQRRGRYLFARARGLLHGACRCDRLKGRSTLASAVAINSAASLASGGVGAACRAARFGDGA